jgi:hypothetical protein
VIYKNPLIPAKAGTQCFCELQSIRDQARRETSPIYRPQNWVPAFAGMSGYQ